MSVELEVIVTGMAGAVVIFSVILREIYTRLKSSETKLVKVEQDIELLFFAVQDLKKRNEDVKDEWRE